MSADYVCSSGALPQMTRSLLGVALARVPSRRRRANPQGGACDNEDSILAHYEKMIAGRGLLRRRCVLSPQQLMPESVSCAGSILESGNICCRVRTRACCPLPCRGGA